MASTQDQFIKSEDIGVQEISNSQNPDDEERESQLGVSSGDGEEEKDSSEKTTSKVPEVISQGKKNELINILISESEVSSVGHTSGVGDQTTDKRRKKSKKGNKK